MRSAASSLSPGYNAAARQNRHPPLGTPGHRQNQSKGRISIAMQRLLEQTKTILAVIAIACIAAFTSTPGSAGTPAAADAAATYKAKCASCHAADGSGSTAKI